MDYGKINSEERKLVKDCLKGSPLAQKNLFKKFYGLVMTICLRSANDKDEAKDILQESFIKVFKNLSNFKFEGSLRTWIQRIVINTAIDKYRKDKQESGKIRIDNNTIIPEAESIVSNLNKDDLMKCISMLPTGYRTVFNLFVIEGYTHKDIADKLGISEGTSKSQLFKAKQILQQYIKERFS